MNPEIDLRRYLRLLQSRTNVKFAHLYNGSPHRLLFRELHKKLKTIGECRTNEEQYPWMPCHSEYKRSLKLAITCLATILTIVHGQRMNNLLRTLTESQIHTSLSDTELKLLLSTVKEVRKQSYDAKLSDPFYESLEGLLLDLRTVTMDNHDAEAFLKPVSKTDVPDYQDVILNPMDLQTMLKKVKQKHYKSKREFKDDLELIWNNCYTYNATENHPLRQCAKRLKAKADRLLQNITDRKERADPPIPLNIGVHNASTPKTNGVATNGHGGRTRSPTGISPSPLRQTTFVAGPSRRNRQDAPFSEMPAIVRSASSMSMFGHLDHELHTSVAPPDDFTLQDRLKSFIPISDDEESDPYDPLLYPASGEIGEKRKLNGHAVNRPRKRARRTSPSETDTTSLWWDAVQSDELLGNGLPILIHASSFDPITTTPPPGITDPPRKQRRSRKKQKMRTNTLLYHMNNNIRTLRRVRSTHAKFAALNQNTEEGGTTNIALPPEIPTEDVLDVIDERPWEPVGSGIELGEESADDCLHWMGRKVLEHAGFQGTSKVALDVLASVTSEYLYNVGRTIRFLCDKYSKKMTPEEIILHTLFESGTTRIYDLERYVKDDVVRYGGRLAELEKKLSTVYRENTTVEAWDDENLFRMEDEEEDGAFVMGNFADSLGDDFLGLRELGIEAEFGLSSLTVPKRLLKGKGKGDQKEGPSASKPSEPPPPFPPPPPLLPLTSKTIDSQIGLLKPYYQQRLAALAPPPQPILMPPPAYPPLPPGAFPSPYYTMPAYPPPPAPSVDGPPTVLPDDAPAPAQTKIGPIGQIIKPASAATTAKKKNTKGKTPAAPPGVDPPEAIVITQSGTSVGGESPKKGKGAVGKKKAKVADALPPVVFASA